MKWRVVLAAVAIGLVALAVSCFNTDNPGGFDDIYMGYPFFCFNTSRSLLISSPPIPRKVIVLWGGFFADLLLYASAGFVVSYLVFNLNENSRLLRFFVKSGALFFLGLLVVLSALAMVNPSPYLTVPPVFIAGEAAFFLSLIAASASTVFYGYYRLFRRSRAQRPP